MGPEKSLEFRDLNEKEREQGNPEMARMTEAHNHFLGDLFNTQALKLQTNLRSLLLVLSRVDNLNLQLSPHYL